MTDWPGEKASGEIKSLPVLALTDVTALAVNAQDVAVTVAIAVLFIPAVGFAAPALGVAALTDVASLNVGPALTFVLESDGGQFTVFLLNLLFPFLHVTLAVLLFFDALRKRVVLVSFEALPSSEALRFACLYEYSDLRDGHMF